VAISQRRLDAAPCHAVALGKYFLRLYCAPRAFGHLPCKTTAPLPRRSAPRLALSDTPFSGTTLPARALWQLPCDATASPRRRSAPRRGPGKTCPLVIFRLRAPFASCLLVPLRRLHVALRNTAALWKRDTQGKLRLHVPLGGRGPPSVHRREQFLLLVLCQRTPRRLAALYSPFNHHVA
jgi:hypothetical protein